MKKIKKIALLTIALLVTTTCIYSFANLKKEFIDTDNFEKHKKEVLKSKIEAIDTESQSIKKTKNSTPKDSTLVLDNVVVYGSNGTWQTSFPVPHGYEYYRVYYENNAPTTATVTIKHSDGKVQHVFKVGVYSDKIFKAKKAVNSKHKIIISGEDGSTVKGILSVIISEHSSY